MPSGVPFVVILSYIILFDVCTMDLLINLLREVEGEVINVD